MRLYQFAQCYGRMYFGEITFPGQLPSHSQICRLPSQLWLRRLRGPMIPLLRDISTVMTLGLEPLSRLRLQGSARLTVLKAHGAKGRGITTQRTYSSLTQVVFSQPPREYTCTTRLRTFLRLLPIHRADLASPKLIAQNNLNNILLIYPTMHSPNIKERTMR